MDGIVVSDAAESLVVASTDGVALLSRGAPTAPVVAGDGRIEGLAIRRVDGERIVAVATENAVRLVGGDGTTRDVPLPAGHAAVRGLFVDAGGRGVLLTEALPP